MPESIQVLQFVTSFHVGGTERQFVNLIKGLEGTRYRPHVACFEAAGSLRREIDPALPFQEICLKSFYSTAAVRAVVGLARYLRRHRIDIVHSTGLYPNVFALPAARLAGTPVVIASVRDMGHMWSEHYLRMQRLACRMADVVVTNARAIASELCRKGYDPARIEVIPNGITPITERTVPPGSLRREIGIAPDTPLIGVLTRIDRVKGLEDFVDAAAMLAATHPTARFAIVGGPPSRDTGEYGRELRERMQARGISDRMTVTGLRPHARELAADLDICVLPSLSEGLSNSILESMAAGKPVVATDVGGNPELVVDGVTGILVPKGDPAALAQGIDRLVREPRLAQEMGRAARARIDAEFTRERLTDRTTQLYQRLLAAKRATRPAAALERHAGSVAS